MGRGSRTVKYASGTATNTITIRNLYRYGGTVWATIYLFIGLTQTGTPVGAIEVLFEYYIMQLFGWPWSELLLAETLAGLLISHFQTWVAGWLVAVAKYGINS